MVTRASRDPQAHTALISDLRQLDELAERIGQALVQPSQSTLTKQDLPLVGRARNSCQVAGQILSNAEVELLKTRAKQGRSQAKGLINKWIESARGPGVVVTVRELQQLLQQIS